MNRESQGISEGSPHSTIHGDGNNALLVDQNDLMAMCSLCRRNFSPINELTGDFEAVCGDCKFLLLEDYGDPALHSRRVGSRGRRNRWSNSELIDFSQQFSQMNDIGSENESPVHGRADQPVDSDAASWSVHHPSLRTTPSGSRRWRRSLSDTESDGFDNLDSLFGETESYMSFGVNRTFYGDSDVISFSAYGGDSDVSEDGPTYLNRELFTHLGEDSDIDSDTDIDPMHAGTDLWNLDDQEAEDDEVEGDDEGEWEEADIEENTINSTGTGVQMSDSYSLTLGERVDIVIRQRHSRPPEDGDATHARIREGRHFAYSGRSRSLMNISNFGNYLDGRRFEELLEHLAETENLRRGAPPTAVSFINSMPRLIIKEEDVKHDSLVCAICKDMLSIGSEVNQLPCSHVYHPSCILPWLSARNSCPLCRYELPTDDKDIEGSHITGGQVDTDTILLPGASSDSDSDVFDGEEVYQNSRGRTPLGQPAHTHPSESSSRRESGRGRWFLFAAAPIFSLVGLALVLWLSNPLQEDRGLIGRCSFSERGQLQIHSSGSPLHRRENSSRRWWSLF